MITLNSSIRVSIIVPIFNAEIWLDRCLNSIYGQSYTNWECICVDDGSCDSSFQIVSKYVSLDSRFRSFSQTNLGPSVARNKGVELAIGEYIMFVDSDDYVDVDYIKNFMMLIDSGNFDICCCGYVNESESGCYKHNDYLIADNNCRNSMLRHLFLGTGGTVCSKIFKSSLVKWNNIFFNSNYKMCEDQLFNMECFCKASSFAIVDSYGYHYNRFSGGLSSVKIVERWIQQLDLIGDMEKKLKENSVEPSVINDCIVLKSRSVLGGIVKNMVCRKDYCVEDFLKEKKVKRYLSRIKINDKFSAKYILPLKLGFMPLIKWVYK